MVKAPNKTNYIVLIHMVLHLLICRLFHSDKLLVGYNCYIQVVMPAACNC